MEVVDKEDSTEKRIQEFQDQNETTNQLKYDFSKSSDVLNKFTEEGGEVDVQGLASTVAKKEREKKRLLKIIGGTSILFLLAIALMIGSVVIGSTVLKDTKVRDGVLVGNQGIPVQVEPTNFSFPFSVYDSLDKIKNIKTVMIPILSNGEQSTLVFNVLDYLFVEKTRIILSGAKYSLEMNRYGHHVIINDPNVDPFQVSDVPSDHFERAILENRVIKAHYSNSIRNRNINSFDLSNNRDPQSLKRDLERMKRGIMDERSESEEHTIMKNDPTDDQTEDKPLNFDESAKDYPEGSGNKKLAALVAGASSGNFYNRGGPIMATATVYLLYYGTFDATYKSQMEKFFQRFCVTPNFVKPTSPLGLLTDSTGRKFNKFTYGGSIVAPSIGTSLSDANVFKVVTNALAAGKFPVSANAIYLVLTGKDITLSSGGCTKYCGWHTYGTYLGTKIVFSAVLDVTKCPNACFMSSLYGGAFPVVNPDSYVEATGSIVSHEIFEAVSDPYLNAYYDDQGYENGDKCAWKFANSNSQNPVYHPLLGDPANVALGTKNYKVQLMWNHIPGAGSCVKLDNA